MRIFLVGLGNSSEFFGSSNRVKGSIKYLPELARTCRGKTPRVKDSESHVSRNEIRCYVTVDGGGNYVTFYELNQRLRKD